MITNAIESDFLQGSFFPGFSDNSTLLIKIVKGFDQRPQKNVSHIFDTKGKQFNR